MESLESLRALTTNLIERDNEAKRWEKRFRAVFDIVPMGILLTKNRQILYVNKGVETLTGYMSIELLGKSTRVLYFSEDEWLCVGPDVLNCINLEETVRIKRKDGKVINCAHHSKMTDIEDLEMVVLLYTRE